MKRTPIIRKTRLKRKPKHLAILAEARKRYDELVAMQAEALGWPDGREACAICLKPPKEGGRKLDIDHAHKAGGGFLRGILCARCNRALPYWVESPWLRAAAAYLEAPPLRVIDERAAA